SDFSGASMQARRTLIAQDASKTLSVSPSSTESTSTVFKGSEERATRMIRSTLPIIDEELISISC
ncbi:hypothetical protein, partial [Prochlorococcus sp. P1344]|uniref:hypothetical protein n=1 Tax=Prochlorococcus sp. P1344 TaxID=2729591 RepID=UPI0019821F43